MTPVPTAPAERAVLLLQRAARGGFPVLIPGAWEPSAVPAGVMAYPETPGAASRVAVAENAVAADRPSAAGLVSHLQRAVVSLIDVLVRWCRARPPRTA